MPYKKGLQCSKLYTKLRKVFKTKQNTVAKHMPTSLNPKIAWPNAYLRATGVIHNFVAEGLGTSPTAYTLTLPQPRFK